MIKEKIKVEIHPNWARLIEKCETKYRFAKLVLLIQNGIPQMVESGVRKDSLQKNNDKRKRI